MLSLFPFVCLLFSQGQWKVRGNSWQVTVWHIKVSLINLLWWLLAERLKQVNITFFCVCEVRKPAGKGQSSLTVNTI